MNDDGPPERVTSTVPASPLDPAVFAVDTERLARLWFRIAVTAELTLWVLDALINYASFVEHGAIQRMFNGTREDALLSWLSVTQTLFVGLTLLGLWAVIRRRGAPRWRRHGWLLIALFFCYMTFDDANQFHERMGSWISSGVEAGDDESGGEGAAADERAGQQGEPTGVVATIFDRFPSYYWQLIFLPFFGSMGLFVLAFLWRELGQPRQRVLVAVAIGLLVVAVGLDFFEGLEEDDDWNLYAHVAGSFDMAPTTLAWFERSPFDTLVHFSKTTEEVLEALANTILLCVFLRQLGREAGEIRVRFT